MMKLLAFAFFSLVSVDLSEGGNLIGRNGRRLLDEADLFMGNDEIAAYCATEIYNVSLVVDSHVQLVAISPLDECLPIIFDSSDNEKRAHLLDPEQDNEELFSGKTLLKASLETIAIAYDLVELDQNMDYDMVNNNCATFVLEMLAYLDHFVDDETLTYTADKLAQHSEIAEMIRANPHAKDVIHEELLVKDNDYNLIYAFTNFYADAKKQAFLNRKA
jgi:hypothetical protein